MRRTKLEPDVQEKVVEAVKQGATFELAALYAGISYSTFNNWMKRGRSESERLEKPRAKPKEKEHVFLQFLEAVKTAEGAAAFGWLKKIEDASKDQWQAAAWKLERRYPKEYGKQIHEHTGADGAAVIRVKLMQGDDDDD